MCDGELVVRGVPDHRLTRARGDSGLKVVDEHIAEDATEECKRAAVAIEPSQHPHVGRETHEERPRPRHHGDQDVDLAAMRPEIDDAELAPINLHLLSGANEESLLG